MDWVAAALMAGRVALALLLVAAPVSAAVMALKEPREATPEELEAQLRQARRERYPL